MTKIAILGSGRVGLALATGLSAAGHSLILGARNVADASAKWTGPAVSFAPLPDAARDASVVFNATPGDSSVATISVLRGELVGKVLIDVGNATVRGPDGIPNGLVYSGSSLAQALQHALPDTRVVKTLNTVLSSVMANPGLLASPATVFMSGDDKDAKATTRTLLNDLGWLDHSIQDLGGLDSARGTEALILLVPYLIRAQGFIPFALTAVR
jgi:8-hydroxy-5-deazaflavin:NADPH oxidoreductase